MAKRKYPPEDDAGILAAGKKMKDNIGTGAGENLSADDITRLETAVDNAQASFDANIVAQSAARQSRQTKDDDVDVLEDILSEFNQRIQPLTTVEDARRIKLGLPVYDTTATVAAKPTDLPVVKIDNSMPMAQLIHFSDEDGKGKAEGAKAAEIHVKVGGDATGNIEDYRFLVQDTESPYLKEFTNPTDAGKQAHYMICWVNSKNERGSFQLASATITSLLQSSGG